MLVRYLCFVKMLMEVSLSKKIDTEKIISPLLPLSLFPTPTYTPTFLFSTIPRPLISLYTPPPLSPTTPPPPITGATQICLHFRQMRKHICTLRPRLPRWHYTSVVVYLHQINYYGLILLFTSHVPCNYVLYSPESDKMN